MRTEFTKTTSRKSPLDPQDRRQNRKKNSLRWSLRDIYEPTESADGTDSRAVLPKAPSQSTIRCYSSWFAALSVSLRQMAGTLRLRNVKARKNGMLFCKCMYACGKCSVHISHTGRPLKGNFMFRMSVSTLSSGVLRNYVCQFGREIHWKTMNVQGLGLLRGECYFSVGPARQVTLSPTAQQSVPSQIVTLFTFLCITSRAGCAHQNTNERLSNIALRHVGGLCRTKQEFTFHEQKKDF